MTVELNHVHMQRLRLAVEAARAGARVEFRMNQGYPPTLVWVDRAAPGNQHTILRAEGRKAAWLAVVRAAFDAEMHELKLIDQYNQTLDAAEAVIAMVRRAGGKAERHG